MSGKPPRRPFCPRSPAPSPIRRNPPAPRTNRSNLLSPPPIHPNPPAPQIIWPPLPTREPVVLDLPELWSTYYFNQRGRPVCVRATLMKTGAPPRGNDAAYLQRDVAIMYGYLSDVGGHLIGHQFYGKDATYNIVPMTRSLNGTGWLAMERLWAQLICGGHKISVEIYIFYPPLPPPNVLRQNLLQDRPLGFRINWMIDFRILQPPIFFQN